VSARFEAIAVTIEGVPILGEYLSMPFFWVVHFLNEVAYYLDLADDWISSLDLEYIILDLQQWVMNTLEDDPFILDYFRRNITGWIMYRLGFDMVDCLLFSYYPIGFIRSKLIEWFPLLGIALDDPFGGLMMILGAEEWEIIEFYGHFLAWLLWRMGVSITEAMLFESDLAGWLVFRLTEVFPWLEILLTDPPGWIMLLLGAEEWELIEFYSHFFAWVLWRLGFTITEGLLFESDPAGWIWLKFMEAVDREIEEHLDWLIGTCGRVISLIWQTRT